MSDTPVDLGGATPVAALALWEAYCEKKALLEEAMERIDRLEARVVRLTNTWIHENQEIEQIAGKVLGYPWYKDDLKNFPDATEADGVCVGEHVTVTIVEELANALTKANALLNTPETANFLEGTKLEAAHQRQRWGAPRDREKSAEHWFWLVGYLSGKALRAAIDGDKEKAKHHTISSAAALSHWHTAITQDESGSGLSRDIDLAKHEEAP